MKKVIVYTSYLNKIGGIETFVYNFCKRLSPYFDITFLTVAGDFDSLYRMADYANVQILDKSKVYECDTCLFSSAWGFNPENNIKADKYIQQVHADYQAYIKNWNFVYRKYKKTTHHVAVGQHVSNQFKAATGLNADYVIYNILKESKIKIKKRNNEVLTFITASRISPEKGFSRMLQMCGKLHRESVNYVWHVYGSTPSKPYFEKIEKQFKPYNVIFHEFKENVQSEVMNADYMVALSDTEGFSYATYESLQAHTPVITTNYPSAKEQVTDGINGYILNMDLSNLDLSKIVNDIPKITEFNELSNEKAWIDVL